MGVDTEDYCYDWAIGNKFQWNLYRNLNIVIQEYASENVFRNMAVISSWP